MNPCADFIMDTMPPATKQKGIYLNRTLLLDLSPIRDRIPILDSMQHAPAAF